MASPKGVQGETQRLHRVFDEGLFTGDVVEVRFRPFAENSTEQVFHSNSPVHGWSVAPGHPYLLMGLRRIQSNIEGYTARRESCERSTANRP